jgi:hypothetical protein
MQRFSKRKKKQKKATMTTVRCFLLRMSQQNKQKQRDGCFFSFARVLNQTYAVQQQQWPILSWNSRYCHHRDPSSIILLMLGLFPATKRK